MPAAARILSAAITVFCAICLLGVTSLAADTGLSPALGDGDDRPFDHPAASPSTDTDIEGRIGSLTDEIPTLDTPVILLEHGSVIVSNDLEGNQTLASVASSSDPIGFSIQVSSNIGSQMLVPSDYIEHSFAVDGSGHLIGIRSVTFSCYIGEYTVRFPSYGTPQYRLTNGSSYTWSDLNISYVSSSNVEVIGAHLNWWGDQFRTLIAVAGLCFLLILAFRRHE